MKEIEELWPGWETVKLIGRGSFGAVYEIQRQMFDEVEKAALKVISIPQRDSDVAELYSDGYDADSITETFRAHLKSIVSEYSLMRKMNGSSNVVNCDDVRYVQHDDGIGWDIFIKMELLTPLTQALPNEVPEETVIRIAKDLCSALALCNKHGIIHRDIKPQNIFVSSNGDYKLGDFGIAKTVEKTMGGTKIGTYKYMAPEVYNNQPYGSSADVYSLGLVLYWLLNERRLPFLPLPPAKLTAGMDEDARQYRLSGETIPVPAHGSAALQQIVLKACEYDPKDRYASAAAMLEDLNKLTSGTVDVSSVVVPVNQVEDKQEDNKTIGPIFNVIQKVETDKVDECKEAPTIGPVRQERHTQNRAVDVKTPVSEIVEETENIGVSKKSRRKEPHVESNTNTKPRVKARMILGVVIVVALAALLILLAGLAFGGYVFYTDYYIQQITDMTLTGSEDTLIVSITTDLDHSLLTVVCTDTYGTRQESPVINGTATFSGLNSNTLYRVKVEVSGLRKLEGETSENYTTPAKTEIVNFSAITGSESGSAILNFTVTGMDTDSWTVSYSADGEEAKSVSFSGHMVTITGLTEGKDYTFTLSSDEASYIVGTAQIQYTAVAPIYAENLAITGCADNKLTVSWDVPEGAVVSSWTVRCYNDSGYDETVTAETNSVIFENVDCTKAYTVEVTAAGMSSGDRCYMTANAMTVSNITVTPVDAQTLSLTWDYSVSEPNGQWFVVYSIDGSEHSQIIRTDSNSAEITPIVPNSTYSITIQLESGATIFGGTTTYKTAEAEKFEG